MASMKIKLAAVKALEDKEGRVTPAKLVAAAKAAGHPLHDEIYRLSDKDAAYQHRLDIAREIIQTVRVVMVVDTHPISTVGYLRDPDVEPHEQGYRSITRIVREQDQALVALHREMDRAQAALERAKEIGCALGLSQEFDDSIGAVRAMSQRIRKGPSLHVN